MGPAYKCDSCGKEMSYKDTRYFNALYPQSYCSPECLQAKSLSQRQSLEAQLKEVDKQRLVPVLGGAYKHQKGITHLPNGEAVVDQGSFGPAPKGLV